MDSRDLTPEQARAVMNTVGRQLAYMGKLRRRMEVLSFPPNDPMYAAVSQAFDALHALHIISHYASCDGNIGLPPKRRPGGRPEND